MAALQQDQLILILSKLTSLNEDERNEASKQLIQFKKQNGSLVMLLQCAVTNLSLDMDLRTQAAIALKNFVNNQWNNLKEIQGKSTLRESIVQSVVISPPIIRNQLKLVLQEIVRNEFPKKWKTLGDELLQFLKQNEIETKLGIIAALDSTFYELCGEKKKKFNAFDKILTNIIPQLLQTAIIIHQSNSMHDNDALLLKSICKLLHRACRVHLTAIMRDMNDLKTLIEFMLAISMKQIPSNLYPDIQTRPQQIWWKCKKWSIKFIYQIYDRYGFPSEESKELQTKEFSKQFMPTLANGIVVKMLEILHNTFLARKEGDFDNLGYISPQVLGIFLDIICISVAHNATYVPSIKQQLPLIVEEIIFPHIVMTVEEANLFDEDPQEFINQITGIVGQIGTPRSIAASLLRKLAGARRQSALTIVIQGLTAALNIGIGKIVQEQQRQQQQQQVQQLNEQQSFGIWVDLEAALDAFGQISMSLVAPAEKQDNLIISQENKLENSSGIQIEGQDQQQQQTIPNQMNPFAPVDNSNLTDNNQHSVKKFIVAQYDREVNQLIVQFVIPCLASTSPYGILKRRALWVIKQYAKFLTTSPSALSQQQTQQQDQFGNLNNNNNNNNSLLLQILFLVTTALDDPRQPVRVMATDTCTALMQQIKRSCKDGIINLDLFKQICGFVPELFNKLLAIFRGSPAAQDTVIEALTRTVRFARQQVAPHALDVFRTIVIDAHEKLLTRWADISKIREQDDLEGEIGSIPHELIEAKKDIIKSQQYNQHGVKLDRDEFQQELKEEETIYGAAELLDEIVYFTMDASNTQTAPNQQQQSNIDGQQIIINQGPSQLTTTLFEQYEPFISQILVEAIDNKDDEVLDAYSQCFNTLCVGIDLGLRNRISKPGLNGNGAALRAATQNDVNSPIYTVFNPPALPVKLSEAFMKLLGNLKKNTDNLQQFLAAIEGICNSQIVRVLNNNVIIIPIINIVR
ncbi:MAG: putative Ran binding protein 7, partial [Streblomastix strix]